MTAAVAALAAAGYFTVSSRTGTSAEAPDGKPASPQPASLQQVAAEGKVEAMPGYEVEVGSELEGRIADIFVREGDVVAQGQPVARIESSEIQAKLREAEAECAVARARLEEVRSGSRDEEIRRATAAHERALADKDLAGSELERYRKLLSTGIVSNAEVDERQRAFKVSSARAKETEEEKMLLEKGARQETLKVHEDTLVRAEASAEYFRKVLDKADIRAPISGKVIRRYLEPGEMVSREVQPTIVAIADTERVRVNAEVDETDIGSVAIGDEVEISSLAYPGRLFRGAVQEIADYAGPRRVSPNNPAKNRDMKIVQVWIGFAEKTPLRFGMTVDVRIRPSVPPNPQRPRHSL